MDKRDENIIEPSPKGNWFSPQIREKQHALQSNELSIRILETIGSSILALAVYFCIFIFNAMLWDSPFILWQIVLIKQPTGQKKAFDEESNNTQGMAINQIPSRSKTCLYHQIDLLLLLIRLPPPYETGAHMLVSWDKKNKDKGSGEPNMEKVLHMFVFL